MKSGQHLPQWSSVVSWGLQDASLIKAIISSMVPPRYIILLNIETDEVVLVKLKKKSGNTSGEVGRRILTCHCTRVLQTQRISQVHDIVNI